MNLNDGLPPKRYIETDITINSVGGGAMASAVGKGRVKAKTATRQAVSRKKGGAKSGAMTERPFPRLRIIVQPGLVLGPGKVELLEAIDLTGSISAAGREMGMSYRRAWLLVSALNEMFGRTLVITSRGGAGGGGAEVTDFGRAVAEAYRRAVERSDRGCEEG